MKIKDKILSETSEEVKQRVYIIKKIIMSKCYDNPDYDDLGSDIQNAWEQHKPEQHVELINDNIEEFDKAIKLFKQETLEEDFKIWDDLFGILAWKFKPTKSGDMYLDGEKVYEELKSKFKLKRIWKQD